MSIVVLGSFMMDLTVRTSRVPQNGETIIGDSFFRSPGGKGANQAVAMARLGAEVTMIGRVGNDLFGNEFISLLEEENVDHQNVSIDNDLATGVGSITLDTDGNNRIVVVPGANLTYKTSDLGNCADVIRNADLLVVQLEMDIEMIEQAITLAYQSGVPIILNPAPAQKLSEELLQKITYLTPNETEAEILTGVKVASVKDAKKAAHVLHARGVENVILTLGDRGTFLSTSQNTEHLSGYQVKALNTVAAGDAFNGALAFEIVRGKSIKESVLFANAVGALAVTKEGAIPSLPRYEEVQRFIESGKFQ
ncbi:ribokinase [Lentibacillus sediminis]|uniref:ribokinase n=1 Tax=Lentibacillus sediminis TaxID=1940529 RepID=UPI000C1BBD91|nr:ribokinase [Lentibacillus sediminis]